MKWIAIAVIAVIIAGLCGTYAALRVTTTAQNNASAIAYLCGYIRSASRATQLTIAHPPLNSTPAQQRARRALLKFDVGFLRTACS